MNESNEFFEANNKSNQIFFGDNIQKSFDDNFFTEKDTHHIGNIGVSTYDSISIPNHSSDNFCDENNLRSPTFNNNFESNNENLTFPFTATNMSDEMNNKINSNDCGIPENKNERTEKLQDVSNNFQELSNPPNKDQGIEQMKNNLQNNKETQFTEHSIRKLDSEKNIINIKSTLLYNANFNCTQPEDSKKNNDIDNKPKINIMSLEEQRHFQQREIQREQTKRLDEQVKRIRLKNGEIPSEYRYNSKLNLYEKIPEIDQVEKEFKEVNYDYLLPENQYAGKLNSDIAQKIAKNPEKAKDIINNEMISKVDTNEYLSQHYNKKLLQQYEINNNNNQTNSTYSNNNINSAFSTAHTNSNNNSKSGIEASENFRRKNFNNDNNINFNRYNNENIQNNKNNYVLNSKFGNNNGNNTNKNSNGNTNYNKFKEHNERSRFAKSKSPLPNRNNFYSKYDIDINKNQYNNRNYANPSFQNNNVNYYNCNGNRDYGNNKNNNHKQNTENKYFDAKGKKPELKFFYQFRTTERERDVNDFITKFKNLFYDIFSEKQNITTIIEITKKLDELDVIKTENISEQFKSINKLIRDLRSNTKDELIVFYYFLFSALFYENKKVSKKKIHLTIETKNYEDINPPNDDWKRDRSISKPRIGSLPSTLNNINNNNKIIEKIIENNQLKIENSTTLNNQNNFAFNFNNKEQNYNSNFQNNFCIKNRKDSEQSNVISSEYQIIGHNNLSQDRIWNDYKDCSNRKYNKENFNQANNERKNSTDYCGYHKYNDKRFRSRSKSNDSYITQNKNFSNTNNNNNYQNYRHNHENYKYPNYKNQMNRYNESNRNAIKDKDNSSNISSINYYTKRSNQHHSSNQQNSFSQMNKKNNNYENCCYNDREVSLISDDADKMSIKTEKSNITSKYSTNTQVNKTLYKGNAYQNDTNIPYMNYVNYNYNANNNLISGGNSKGNFGYNLSDNQYYISQNNTAQDQQFYNHQIYGNTLQNDNRLNSIYNPNNNFNNPNFIPNVKFNKINKSEARNSPVIKREHSNDKSFKKEYRSNYENYELLSKKQIKVEYNSDKSECSNYVNKNYNNLHDISNFNNIYDEKGDNSKKKKIPIEENSEGADKFFQDQSKQRKNCKQNSNSSPSKHSNFKNNNECYRKNDKAEENNNSNINQQRSNKRSETPDFKNGLTNQPRKDLSMQELDLNEEKRNIKNKYLQKRNSNKKDKNKLKNNATNNDNSNLKSKKSVVDNKLKNRELDIEIDPNEDNMSMLGRKRKNCEDRKDNEKNKLTKENHNNIPRYTLTTPDGSTFVGENGNMNKYSGSEIIESSDDEGEEYLLKSSENMEFLKKEELRDLAKNLDSEIRKCLGKKSFESMEKMIGKRKAHKLESYRIKFDQKSLTEAEKKSGIKAFYNKKVNFFVRLVVNKKGRFVIEFSDKNILKNKNIL